MADQGGAVLRIASEADAWEALNWLLKNRREAAKASLELVDLSWAKVDFAYRGERFHQTVTSSIMRGLVEYQNDLYRSVARLTRDDGRITRLTEDEKMDLELVFQVHEGSSHLLADVKDTMKVLGVAVEKLTGRQALIGIIVLLLLFFGTIGVGMYFQHTVELKRIEAEEKGRAFDIEEKKDLYELIEKLTSGDNAATMESAIKTSPVAAEIGEYHRHGYDEIIRNSSGVDELVLQNAVVSAAVIEEITRSSRATSEKITLKEAFFVTGVESDNPDVFTVHLDSADGDYSLVAELEDPLVGSRYQRAISNAEWSNKPVIVHIAARQVGSVIKDAKILKAYAPRVRKA